jgi:hypothetical protein
MRRSMLLASAAVFGAALATPPAVAQPAVQTAAAEAPITFAQYRDFRLEVITRREEGLALRLADPGLPAADKAKFEGEKAYWDRWASLPAAERDRLFRERFDEIDSDHDGTIDTQERAAWRAHQRDYYRQLAERHRTAEPR